LKLQKNRPLPQEFQDSQHLNGLAPKTNLTYFSKIINFKRRKSPKLQIDFILRLTAVYTFAHAKIPMEKNPQTGAENCHNRSSDLVCIQKNRCPSTYPSPFESKSSLVFMRHRGFFAFQNGFGLSPK
jgi:hypothetical protein